ncbi:MAG: hypothetical protein AAFV54_09480 [Pseudomonadota bacterium]
MAIVTHEQAKAAVKTTLKLHLNDTDGLDDPGECMPLVAQAQDVLRGARAYYRDVADTGNLSANVQADAIFGLVDFSEASGTTSTHLLDQLAALKGKIRADTRAMIEANQL